MNRFSRLLLPLLLLASTAPSSRADSAAELTRKSERAIQHLYKTNRKAGEIGEKAIAVLVFPEVYKAGFMIGAQRGDGVLFRDGKVAGYYNTTAASYGLQAGIQKFAYALFFMDQQSLDYFNKSNGFELGGAPSLTVVDEGVASSLSTTTLQKGIYAFFFSQKGLMAGLSLQGTKITKYHPSE